MIEQCDLVIISGPIDFDLYVERLKDLDDIAVVKKSKGIIYRKHGHDPIYVKYVNKLNMMNGFNKRINNVEVFISPASQRDYGIANKLCDWMDMVSNINARFIRQEEE